MLRNFWFFYRNLIEGLVYVVLSLSWPKVEQQPKEHQKGHRKVLKELQQTVFQDLICRLVQLPFLRVYLDIFDCCSGTSPLGHLYSKDTSILGHKPDSSYPITIDQCPVLKPSLPADVLWGLFVTHSFLPQMNAWGTNPKGGLRGGYSKPRLPDMPRDAAAGLE